MNISKIAVFVAVWAIAALIGYYQDWGLVMAGILALPLWLLWAFSGDGRARDSYGREARRRQSVKIWGVLIVIVGLCLLCWFPGAPWIFNWIALGLGVLSVLIGFSMACKGWRKVMGLVALGVVMMCYGFVPHPQYRYVGHYRAYDYSPYGVKVIEGFRNDPDAKPLYGLADRYGVILKPEYVNFYLLDRHQPFLALDNGRGVAIYDLERHEMVVPFNDDCAKVVVIGEKRYEMVDSAGRAYAEIELPRTYNRDLPDSRLKLSPVSHETPEPEELLAPEPAETRSPGSASAPKTILPRPLSAPLPATSEPEKTPSENAEPSALEAPAE